MTQYVQTVFTEEQGLPQNTVNAITQTRDGYLWIGTEEGLVRFDGARFTVFDRKTTPEIRNNFVMALHEDRSGGLWIGTFGGGLVRLRRGRFELFTKESGLPSERMRSFHEDAAGTLWVATSGGGLSRFANGRFSTVGARDGLGTDRIWSVVTDPRGRLFVGTYGSGVKVLEAGGPASLPLGGPPAAAFIRPMLVDRDGNVWVGTDGGGLFRVGADGQVRSFGAAEGLGSASIRSLCADRDGSVWVGTDGAGLLRFRDGRFEPLTSRDGLANDFVLALHEDREGSLWVGTSGGGLARLRDGKLTNLTAREGLGNEVVRAVLEDSRGAIWAGTTGGGVTRFVDGKATVLRALDGLSSDLVFALHEDASGRLWIGTDGAGVTVLEKGRFRRLTTADGLANDRVRTICSGADGAVWIGTLNGLSCYRDGRFETFTPREGLPGNSVRTLLAGRDGSLWIGTDGGGLGRFRDGAFTVWRTAEGLSSLRVFSLHEDERGTLWVGTSGGGLHRLRDGKLKAITSRDGLHDDVVFQILGDTAGFLWTSSNRGIARVSRDELDRFADGRMARVSSRAFGTADGMRSAECNGGSPAGIRTRDGRLLFPTIRGIAVVDPARLPVNALPPPVHVEELVVDGRSVPIQGEVRLPPGAGRLELRYTAPSLVVPERVRFRYRLEGFDRDWVDAGTRRATTYTNLPHGRYTFRVAAANDDGVWNEAGASLPFSVAPVFYRTGWFLGLVATAAAGAAFGLHRLRMRRLETREAELERVVAQRTGELKQRSEELQRAQEQIERLSATTSGVLEDPAAWARSASRELARTLGAREIGIWVVEGGAVVPLAPSSLPAPDWSEMREALRDDGILARDTRLVVPVLGMTGEPRGVVVVDGSGTPWGEVQRRVIASLARHLGTALDLRVLKERLVSSELARAESRHELHRKGIHLAAVCPQCRDVLDDAVEACPKDGAVPDWSRLLPLRPGGRYLLVRWLGEGGMGTVFQARDERLGRMVVVKVIRPDRLRDPGARLRFEREARIVAQVRHRGVVAVFDTGDLDDGSAYLVMEYLAGLSLADVLGTFGRGTCAQVARLARDVGGALGAAHAAGVVHRDVKPANVFLAPGPEGLQAKVLDFGVAKSREMDGNLTRTGVIVGTPVYMAPEQALGEPADARSDLYSLAAVLFEALTGVRLVAESDLSRILSEVAHGTPRPPSSLLPGLPAEVDAAFAAALAKRRDERPPGVPAWAERLAALLEAIPPGTIWAEGWPAVLPEARAERGAWRRAGETG